MHKYTPAEIASQVALPLHLEDPVSAANLALDMLHEGKAEKPQTRNAEEAFIVLNALLQSLLDNDLYAEAAKLLWKPTQFSAEPDSVRSIFDALFSEMQVLVQGAASMGKSFSIGVWMYLDWRRDPENTNVLVVGPSENHLQQNLFSHLVSLHNNSAIPGPGTCTNLCIALNPHDQYAGIKGVVIPLGKKSAGRLQGVKVKPRKVAHPKLGRMTRLRVILEEAENIHVGVWEDLINLSANAANATQFKVVAAYNPKDRTSQVGIRAEPEGGWGSVDIETSFSWRTKRGWRLIRLDGHKSENVLTGQELYPGMQTRRGLEMVTLQAGGARTAGWFCADERTECLTQRGWLKHDEVRVGDWAWALNLKTGKAEWSLVEEVFSAPFSGELLSVEGRSLSALVTPDHRWPVTDKLRKQRGTGYAIKTAEKLAKNNILPLVAEPEACGRSDAAFCALLGWLITDGTVDGDRITIYQSRAANPEKCRRLEEDLARAGLEWTETDSPGDGMRAYRVRASATGKKAARLLGREKRFPLAFLIGCDWESRRRFLDAAILGDGGTQGGSTAFVVSATKEHIDGFVAIAATLGVASTVHAKKARPAAFPNGKTHPGGGEYWQVDFLRHTEVLAKYQRVERVHHEGHIWCPRTTLSTWFCRRNGKVHFTGNTMARGWYPEDALDMVVIPPGLLKDEHCRGEFIWAEEPETCGFLDVALEGGDNAILCVGRYGKAYGVRKHPDLQHPDGETVHFKTPEGRRLYRSCLQIDQLVKFPKGRTEELVENAKKACQSLGIKAELLGVDRTGNGAGVHDLLVAKMGSAVKGINASESSSEMRILAEDQKLPCDEYTLLCTELWFATKKWLDVGVLKFGPNVPMSPLTDELGSRRYLQPHGNPRVKVESKKEYKSRGNKSPDHADALTGLVHTIRLHTSVTQSYGGKEGAEDSRPMRHRVDVTNRFQRLD